MNNYIADTTVIIDMLRGDKKARVFIEKQPSISTVTIGELIEGCKDKKQLRVVQKTCEILPQVNINSQISKTTIVLMMKYYLSHGLLLFDAIIAASCIEMKKILVTDNIRDFRFIPELHIISHKEAFE